MSALNAEAYWISNFKRKFTNPPKPKEFGWFKWFKWRYWVPREKERQAQETYNNYSGLWGYKPGENRQFFHSADYPYSDYASPRRFKLPPLLVGLGRYYYKQPGPPRKSRSSHMEKWVSRMGTQFLPEPVQRQRRKTHFRAYKTHGGRVRYMRRKKPKKVRNYWLASPLLQEFSVNLTKKAFSGVIDPVIGRDIEVERVVQILGRRQKNNPILLGEPGVGKTAIAEGLALQIHEKVMPPSLQALTILSLDLAGLVAGSKYRGEFEQRLKLVLDEVMTAGNIVLVVDEVHTLVGAGSAEGSLDAANILKPSLARGEFKCIGATTNEEYRKYILRDSALERRFQPVEVKEPSVEDTIQILSGLRPRYEYFHNVKLTIESIRAAALLTKRYVTERFLPDKAIDIIDEASARVGIGYLTLPNICHEFERQLCAIVKQKKEHIKKGDLRLSLMSLHVQTQHELRFAEVLRSTCLDHMKNKKVWLVRALIKRYESILFGSTHRVLFEEKIIVQRLKRLNDDVQFEGISLIPELKKNTELFGFVEFINEELGQEKYEKLFFSSTPDFKLPEDKMEPPLGASNPELGVRLTSINEKADYNSHWRTIFSVLESDPTISVEGGDIIPPPGADYIFEIQPSPQPMPQGEAIARELGRAYSEQNWKKSGLNMSLQEWYTYTRQLDKQENNTKYKRRTSENLQPILKTLSELEWARDYKKLNSVYWPAVLETDIREVVASWTGVPVSKVSQTEREKLLRLDEELAANVIGQPVAVKAVTDAVRRARVGLRNPTRPIASLLFCGPTGVGKTEVAKALARAYFGGEETMLRFDMSEYMERIAVAKFIGAPPGYVGYGEGGLLTEPVRRRPFVLILLDEVEKAHPDVYDILLQVLDDGRLTDGMGRRVIFKNTMIILTSNVGSVAVLEATPEIPKKSGQKRPPGFWEIKERQYKDMNLAQKEVELRKQINHPAKIMREEYEFVKKLVVKEVARFFRPEFINRLDEVVVFRQLNEGDIISIGKIMIRNLTKRLQEQDCTLQVSPQAFEGIIENGYDPRFGARPLRRSIMERLENTLALTLLETPLEKGYKYLLWVDVRKEHYYADLRKLVTSHKDWRYDYGPTYQNVSKRQKIREHLQLVAGTDKVIKHKRSAIRAAINANKIRRRRLGLHKK